MKILCTGDVHIGRRASRLPPGADGRAHSCGAAWGRVVELALRERVELVAVSGDLVDRANRFYEAAGPVQEGLRRLAHAGIATVLVAGNHDHDVLPWLTEGLDAEHVRLLGQRGQWERFTFQRGGEVLHVDGWSFPESTVRTSPLASYPFAADGAPVLGLLHAELEQPQSPYAPVSLAELRARAPRFWLLGHVHAPRLRAEPGAAAVLYPGSPQAMDPGEAGEHGAWIVEIGAGREVSCRAVPLSSVRYEVVEVDADGVALDAELDHRLVDAVRARLEQVAAATSPLRWLGCRVRVTGRTPLHRTLEARLRAVCAELELQSGDVTAMVEAVEVRTRPAREVEALAQGRDAAGVVARLVHALGNGGPEAEHEPLLREAARRAAEVGRGRPYLLLGDEPPGEGDLLPALQDQAALLLDELLAQKEVDA